MIRRKDHGQGPSRVLFHIEQAPSSSSPTSSLGRRRLVALQSRLGPPMYSLDLMQSTSRLRGCCETWMLRA